MLKYSHFSGQTEFGISAIPLFGKADDGLEKCAATGLMPAVSRYIERLRPRADAQYVLVNAMGAGEYYGSNINGDHFPEAGLIHRPDNWHDNPVLDKITAKTWAYGYPTFYLAHPYAHHRNKDSSRAFGEVELALWNDRMKRVELVTRVDRDKCLQFGGVPVWDKLKQGQYPDVSMGCVPAGTRVMLADGSFKNMECMQEADLVLSHRGAVKRVDEVLRYRYKGVLYKFKAYGFLRELCLTANHPLWLVKASQTQCHPKSTSERSWDKELVQRQRHCTPLVKEVSAGCSTCSVEPSYKFDWVRADETEVGDYVAFPVPDILDETVTSAAEAKFLGYYLAEGHVGNYNDRPLEQITFSLNLLEKELAEEIETLGRSLGATVAWHSEDSARGARSVTVVSKELAQRCIRFCGSGAKTKQLSRETLYMRPDLQLAFLGAYLDGDGGTYKGSAYFSTASEQLSQQIFIVLARCGMIASINEIDHKPSEKSVVRKDTVEYQVWVGTDFSHLLGTHTRKPVRASKKVRGQRFFYLHGGVRYLMSPIVEIVEEDYDDDVFNISVEGDDSYVAERLATHNTKVPYDTCSICLDWKMYREALATYKPGKFLHPGQAALAFHKGRIAQGKGGIRGLSITRKDYCQHALREMSRIYPDGRKVWVYNDYPRFFDISFVFIGADKTAKVMLFIFKNGKPYSSNPSSIVAESLGIKEGGVEKTAGVDEELIKEAFGKLARPKFGEISKNVVPSQFAGKAVPLLTGSESDLPDPLLDGMSSIPLSKVLSTTASMGIVLKPREFQRMALLQLNKKPFADELDLRGEVFGKSKHTDPMEMGHEHFMPALAELLMPHMHSRCCFGPVIEQRVTIIRMGASPQHKMPTSHSEGLLDKISAAYNGYRDSLMKVATESQNSFGKHTSGVLYKMASATMEDVFTPLSIAYMQTAHLDAFGVYDGGVVKLSDGSGQRGEGFPLEEHVELKQQINHV